MRSSTPTTAPDAPVTPINAPEEPVTATQPAQANTIQAALSPEPPMLEPTEEVPMKQQGEDSQLGGFYITNMQTENVSNVSLCSLDSVAHKYLKKSFQQKNK